MSLRINNNPASVNGIKNLQKNSMMVGKSMEKLSSGLRINRAADDAAGLIISEQMRAQITGLSTAISNSETAVNMVQTAEGALDEMNSMLNKARSLALQAANEGANDTAQTAANQTELNNIIDSITRIAENTQFGTKKILDGSLSSFKSNSDIVGSTSTGNGYIEGLESGSVVRGFHSLRVTTQATQGNLHISGGGGATGLSFINHTGGTIEAMSGNTQFNKGFTVALDGQEVSISSGQTKNDLLNALNAVGKDAGFTAVIVSGAAGATSSYSGTLAGTSGNIALIYNDSGASKEVSYSFVSGHTGAVDFATTNTAGTNMVAELHLNSGAVGAVATSGNTSVTLTQSGIGSEITLKGASGYSVSLAGPLTISGGNTTGGMYNGVINGVDAGASFQVGANAGQTVDVTLSSMKAADIGQGVDSTFRTLESLKAGALTGGFTDTAINVIDKAIDDVTQQRGQLGAFQANTLETGINNLKVTRENLIGAESTVRDVDFAVESANFTKLQIMVQSSTAMLAQANQLPNNVLQLLG